MAEEEILVYKCNRYYINKCHKFDAGQKTFLALSKAHIVLVFLSFCLNTSNKVILCRKYFLFTHPAVTE